MASDDKDKPRQFGLVEVGQLLGLVAGLTTLVYVSGAAVLWTRLSHKHLPPEGVSPSLPRQLPIMPPGSTDGCWESRWSARSSVASCSPGGSAAWTC